MQEYLGPETRYPLSFTCSGVKVPVKKIFRFYAVPDALYVPGLFETCGLTQRIVICVGTILIVCKTGRCIRAEKLDGEQLNLYES